jgi:DNA modification methylase
MEMMKAYLSLQLDKLKGYCILYSNEGDTVLSPFGGIGSEGCTCD